MKVAAICFRLEPVPICALLGVIIAGCILVGARTCFCICTFVCECLCMCVYVFMHMQSYHCLSPTRLPLLFCLVSFRFPLLLAGNKHWLSVSSLRSSFRSGGSGGWADVVQECQALFRKLGFCFVPLLDRGCLWCFVCLFVCFCLGHIQGLGPQSSLLPAVCFPLWNHMRWQQRLGRLILSLVGFG